MRITELQYDAEFEDAFPVIHDLHDDLDERRYREPIPEMRAAGYRMFAVREKEGLVVGVQRFTSLLRPPHFYVHDLSVAEGARPKGHGERLLRGTSRGRPARGVAATSPWPAAGNATSLSVSTKSAWAMSVPATPCARRCRHDPKSRPRGCPIFARNGVLRVGQSGP